MKRVLSFILTLTMCLSLCACASGQMSESEIRKKVERAVQGRAKAYCIAMSYGDLKSVQASVSSMDAKGTNKYDVKGYITIVDGYGDTYKAKFDGSVELYEDGRGLCDPFFMETPRKQ